MSDEFSKHDHILMSLSLHLQSIAMMQLGKVSNPATGEVEADLDGARGTIDILEMLKVKCRTDTPAPVVRLLDQAVMDLQMNYLDEVKRARRAQAEGQATTANGPDQSASPAGDPTEPAQDGDA